MTATAYLQVEDIARVLGESDARKVRRWITTQMVHERHGRRLKVTQQDFDDWRAGRRVVPAKARRAS